MPGPSYLGDRVGSNAGARSLPGLKRRTNALENSIWVNGDVLDVDSKPFTIDSDDNVHIMNLGYSVASGFAITKVDSNGKTIKQYGVMGSGSTEVDTAGDWHEISYGAGGKIWFEKNGIVYKFSTDGDYEDEFTKDSNRTRILASRGGTNFLYLHGIGGDAANEYQYNTSLVEQDEWTSRTFLFRRASDAAGNIYFDHVADVHKYSNTETLLTTFSSKVDEGDSVIRGIAIKRSGSSKIAVGTGSENIQTIDTDDTEIAKWSPGGANLNFIDVDSSGLIYSTDGTTIEKYDFDGNLDSSFTVYQTGHSFGQTTWYKYPTDDLADKVSLGTPDGGVSIPAANALQGLRPRPNDIYEVRAAIEAMAQHFTNVVTGNAFNWTDPSADNLFHVAVTASIYDWPNLLLPGIRIRENHLEELLLCIAKLEASVMSG